MLTRSFKADDLSVNIYDTRKHMGEAAAADISACIREKLSKKKEIYMIFAAAPSQNEMLEALVSDQEIEWGRIHAFHMDEYVNLSAEAPQGFGNFLRRAIFDKVPFASVNLIGTDVDFDASCRRYDALLSEHEIDIVCMGIGENGHIAFNDPHVADFNDSLRIKKVELDQKCRQQQVNDGCFCVIDQVPTHALTLTIPMLMSAKTCFCVVPAVSKAKAVYDTIKGEISESCPASILRRHDNAILYLDSDSSNLI